MAAQYTHQPYSLLCGDLHIKQLDKKSEPTYYMSATALIQSGVDNAVIAEGRSNAARKQYQDVYESGRKQVSADSSDFLLRLSK